MKGSQGKPTRWAERYEVIVQATKLARIDTDCSYGPWFRLKKTPNGRLMLGATLSNGTAYRFNKTLSYPKPKSAC